MPLITPSDSFTSPFLLLTTGFFDRHVDTLKLAGIVDCRSAVEPISGTDASCFLRPSVGGPLNLLRLRVLKRIYDDQPEAIQGGIEGWR